ncbi:lipase maturation factor 2-like [Tigriopus californicus]|uniref:lipase maturation factor 2-like n=1 Tax=Tigriopus californicus TaxID=6832 RepID=UPI0027DA444F|nr:lipase maturation factor 2-like [Tigriopus californicus]
MVEYHRTRGLFLRGVTFCYAVAFLSLYIQIPGLYGPRGILPAEPHVSKGTKHGFLWTQSGWNGFLDAVMKWNPQLLPLGQNYLGLQVHETMEVFCLLGATLAAFMTFWTTLCNRLLFVLLWLFYKSMFDVGQTFLWFQWDTLLLEVGFLSILVAPVRSQRFHLTRPWDVMTLGLVRWLLFRMMFASGCVKLISKCPTWWGLTALPVHFESQCLPTYLSWFAFQAPEYFHKLSVVGTYIIEIPMTFLFFAPTKFLRQLTFWAQIKLMVIIMLTGNYNFFNFLYIALCFSLMDDSWLEYGPRRSYRSAPSIISMIMNVLGFLALILSIGYFFFDIGLSGSSIPIVPKLQFNYAQFIDFVSESSKLSVAVGWAFLAWNSLQALQIALRTSRSLFGGLINILFTNLFVFLSAFMFCLSVPTFLRGLGVNEYPYIPTNVPQIGNSLGHLHLTSSYGLFRSMTGVGGRPELIIEGSNSMKGPWREYNFLYKPGALDCAPKMMLPHQPRLDWQLWFAALGSYQQNPWFISLVYRILQNEHDVLNLMDKELNPFPDRPPKFVRAQLYHYHFTQSIRDRHFWSRDLKHEYLPPISLDSQEIIQYLKSINVLDEARERRSKNSTLRNPIQSILDVIRGSIQTVSDRVLIWSLCFVCTGPYLAGLSYLFI